MGLDRVPFSESLIWVPTCHCAPVPLEMGLYWADAPGTGLEAAWWVLLGLPLLPSSPCAPLRVCGPACATQSCVQCDVSVALYTVVEQQPLRPAAAAVSVAAAASPVAQRNGSAACRTRSDAVCGETKATARGPALIKVETSARCAILGGNNPGNIPAPLSFTRHGAPWQRRWRTARWGLTPP